MGHRVADQTLAAVLVDQARAGQGNAVDVGGPADAVDAVEVAAVGVGDAGPAVRDALLPAGAADEVALRVGGAQEAAALVGEGAGLEVLDAVIGVVGEVAAVDPGHGGPARVVAGAAVEGRREEADLAVVEAAGGVVAALGVVVAVPLALPAAAGARSMKRGRWAGTKSSLRRP